MIVKAEYEETHEPCFVNMDYVIDVFPHKNGYLAYTFDNERRGYVISKSDFENFMDKMNGGTE